MLVSSIPATLILPMMPSLGVAFSVDATQLGLLVGIYPLMSMLASPFWGKLSDRYGRKPILIITLLGGAAAFMCFALSTSWLGLLIGRALQGLAGTPRGIGFAVASDMAGPGERASGMGAVTAAMAIGFTVGPLMGGLLMGENPDSWLGALRAWLGLAPGGFSHVVPSLFGVLLNVGAAVIIVLTFHETWKPGSVAAKPRRCISALRRTALPRRSSSAASSSPSCFSCYPGWCKAACSLPLRCGPTWIAAGSHRKSPGPAQSSAWVSRWAAAASCGRWSTALVRKKRYLPAALSMP